MGVALIADPIGSRFVASLSHPGGNLSGFTVFEATIASKSLELLREIAPGIKRVAMIFNPDTAPFVNSLMPVFETAAKSFNIALPMRDGEFEYQIKSITELDERVVRESELRPNPLGKRPSRPTAH